MEFNYQITHLTYWKSIVPDLTAFGLASDKRVVGNHRNVN